MRATNSITQQAQRQRVGFTATISADSVQRMINTALKDPRRAASFTSTLISLVNSNKKLQECEPASVISAALRGEAMNLSLALQQYSVVPYGSSANFQLSYKGLQQLATRSGQYKILPFVDDVREGEYLGRDPITRQPSFNWIDDDVARDKLPIVGYYGYYELMNGATRRLYWTYDKILNHANRYSKAFDKGKYERLLAGKLSKEDIKSVTRSWDRNGLTDAEAAARIREGSPWYDDPTSEAHMKMCKKTVLIQMLGDGIAPLSLEMATAIKEDQMAEQGGQFFSADDPRVVAANAPASQQEAPSAPEIVTEAEEVVMAPAKENAPVEAPAKEPAKAKAPARTAAPSKDDEDPFMNPPVVDSNGQLSLV